MSQTELETHWGRVYETKAVNEVSWFRPHLDTSLALIRETGLAADAAIIDVGAGASTLIDDLLAQGYQDVTVLDVSATALEIARARLGERRHVVKWLAGDVTEVRLPVAQYQVWHDRAVFHFLTDPVDRDRYIAQVQHAVAPGGYVIVGTFGPEGPQRCSGLPTARYDAKSLPCAFGSGFELVSHREECHLTPAGIRQQFVYCL